MTTYGNNGITNCKEPQTKELIDKVDAITFML